MSVQIDFRASLSCSIEASYDQNGYLLAILVLNSPGVSPAELRNHLNFFLDFLRDSWYNMRDRRQGDL